MEVFTYSIQNDITAGSVNLVKLEKEIKDSGCVTNYGSLSTAGDVLELRADAINDATALTNILSNHNPSDPISDIKTAYKSHQKAGVEYFEEIRADLVYDYNTGTITASDVFDVEARLEKVIAKLIRGDWMTAQNEMANVTVGGSLTQTLYDDINNYISNYITNNY